MQTSEDMRAILVEKALVDADFRNRLIADPKGVAASELGITIPDKVDFVVHESDKYTFHLTLPPSAELDDEQLEMIAAGLSCCL